MPRDRVQQRSFTGGEISPYLDARADLQRWHTSLSKIENFVCMVQGGATRRSGFRDVLEAQTGSVLIPFIFSANDAYAIEVAEEVCRFFRDFGYLIDEDEPFELETAFSAEDVATLDYAQSADALFLACGNRPIQKLVRNDTTDWEIDDIDLKNGPFMDENKEDGISLSTNTALPIEKDEDFNLIADDDLFVAGHVGALWKISIIDRSKYKLWQPLFTVEVGDKRYWGENFYIATEISAGHSVKTGMVPPIHTFGEEWDGAGPDSNLGVKWKWLHASYGVAKIKTVTDAKHAVATAQTYIPDELEDGTWRWSEGAWSDYRGFPRVLAFHKKRLFAASTNAQPSTLWASKIDDYPNFKQGTLATDGFAETLQGGSNQVNQILWMQSRAGRLWIGTSGDEFAIPTSATREPLKPENADVDGATSEGSAAVKPAVVDSVIFVSKDKRRLHETGFDFATDSYLAPDITLFADHVTGSGILQLAWQREPYRLLWARRADGVLACATLRKDQQVNAWHRHPITKGAVKSICSVPSPSGIRQDLWAIIEYALSAGTVRRVQSLMPFFERGDLDVKGACFVDSAFIYDGAPAATISDIPSFMEGETVRVLADGKVQKPKVVTGGSITLSKAASKVLLGLGYSSTLRSLRYDRDLNAGGLTGKKQHVGAIVVDLLRAASVKIAADEFEPEYIVNEAGKVMDASAPLMSGPSEPLAVDSDWDGDGSVTILCEDPLPATIRAFNVNMKVSG